jgi:transposase
MATQRRTFDRDFKLRVVAEIDAGSSVAQAAREHGVHPRADLPLAKAVAQIWERALADRGHAYTEEARIAQLERTLGRWRQKMPF